VLVIPSTPPMGRKSIVVCHCRPLKLIRQLSNFQSFNVGFLSFGSSGENLVSKSSVQVQATGEGKGHGGAESTQSGTFP
jgi:hypothetical protein